MRLLQGEIEPTHGRIQWHTQQHFIGYLQQDTANSEGTQSGGEKMKEALQQLWSQHPSLLILDEPPII
jgi:ATPase subunit of ABC transporter with duplicated ATPase domains